MKSYAQYQEDLFLVEFFKGKTHGFYIDIGANNGVDLSNTFLLENEYDWAGVLVEPIPSIFEQMKTARINNRTKSVALNCAVHPNHNLSHVKFYCQTIFHELSSYKYEPMHAQRIAAEQQARPENEVNEILVDTIHIDHLFYHIPGNEVDRVDFLSIDTEGTELEILQSLNWELNQPKTILVENNYHDRALHEFIISKRYRLHPEVFGNINFFYIKNNYDN